MRTTFLLLLLVVVGIASAHVPLLPGENDHLDAALTVTDPEKSWVIYGTLDTTDQPQYYSLPLQPGERMQLTLIVPRPEIDPPSMAILGPGIPSPADIPPFLEVPEGAGVAIVPGRSTDEAEYEPFTPSAIYPVGEYTSEIQNAGPYYVAVYGREGAVYSLAIGYKEEFSPVEWIVIPLSVLEVHLWEGQSLAFLLAPLIGVIGIGGGILFYRISSEGRRLDLPSLFSIAAGLLYLGGSAITLTQMGIALSQTGPSASAGVTILLFLIPVILGILLLRWGWRTRAEIGIADRFVLLVLGLLGLFLWAGVLIGPALVFLGAIAPRRFKSS